MVAPATLCALVLTLVAAQFDQTGGQEAAAPVGDAGHKVYDSMKQMLKGSLGASGSNARDSVRFGVRDRANASRSTSVGGRLRGNFAQHADADRKGRSTLRESGNKHTFVGKAAVQLAAKRIQRAYRSQCYLRTNSQRFTIPPANYALSEPRKLIYFEIPKSASTAVRQILNNELQVCRGCRA